ncbi:MAG: disulfide oxidoreductase, partial [Pseudooceanicola sp.]|nr:disulfide oxidoreductase [Pseudooceanicola sp.]
ALSPRTRNAQVALYQNGDVDYLVATDAIGMGLNLDIDHVAFSSLTKFDGRRMRPLQPNELAQIAGRAGRGMANGTFGVTGEASPLDEGVAQAIMDHRFAPLKRVNWRNSDLRFGTVEALIASLEVIPEGEYLTRAREADDLLALKSLSSVNAIAERATDGPSVRLLWDVCRIPDFRSISEGEHASLLEAIYTHLADGGQVPDDWLARQIRRIDRTDGDIDALSKRLAFIRTWTYVAQRKGWTADETHWREETRAVEDRISDALHERLTQRFVDRRTSVLMRRLNQKEALLAEVNDKGEVTVEGEFVGRLEGFRFSPDRGAAGAEEKAIKAASLQALAPQFHLRADRFYNAPDTEIDFTEQGGLMWGEHAVGKLVAGQEPLRPQVSVFVDDVAGPDVAQKVQRRLQHFIDRKIAALFEPLLALSRDEALTGLARGFAFRMVEGFGILGRAAVAQEVKDLDQDARGALRKHGIRFGQFTIFMPLLLKPAPTRLRLVLWSLAQGLSDFPSPPPPGLVTIPSAKGMPQGYHTMSGYREAGERAIRIDMLERLADMLRAGDTRGGFEAKPDMLLSITGMTLDQFADLMRGLGYRAERGERVKVKAVDAVLPEAETPVSEDVPVMDRGEEGSAVPGPETAEPADVAEAAAEPVDEGIAPVAETPETDGEVPADLPEVADSEVPVGTAADSGLETPETEVFYTFTWARERPQGRPQGDRQGKPRRRDGEEQGRGRGKPKGKGPKGPRPDKDAPKPFAARPPREEKKIDPDNPFAAALAGFKVNK